MAENPYPESEKLAAAREKRQILLDFLEHLRANGISLCTWSENTWHFLEISGSDDQRVQDYLGIDQVKLEEERRAMLEMLRHTHK